MFYFQGFGRITANVAAEAWWKAIPRYVSMLYLIVVSLLAGNSWNFLFLELEHQKLNLSVIDLMSYYHIGKTNKYLERGISIVLGEKQAERFRQSFDQPLRAERDREYKEKLKRQSIYQPKVVQTRSSLAV